MERSEIRVITSASHCRLSSPRKRGPIFQRRWLWVPAFAGTTIYELIQTRYRGRALTRISLRSTRAMTSLIPRVSRRARERDRVAHIGQARDVGKRALEAEPEAGMRHGAVAAQIPVPAVVL